jgi:hypothetical protein
MAAENIKTGEQDHNKELREPTHPDLEIFADGVNGIWVRSGIMKIDLYQTTAISTDGKGEYRRLSQRVSLPLAALSEIKDALQRIESAIAATKSKSDW